MTGVQSTTRDAARRRPIRRVIDQWFPHRQLLIRGADRVSAVSLTQRLQVFALCASVLVIISVTAAGLTAAWSLTGSRIESEKARRLAAILASDQATLRRVTAQNASLLAERNQAVADATAKLAALHEKTAAQMALAHNQETAQQHLIAAANAAAMQQLNAQTESTISQVEHIIKSTGLDPDRLVGTAPAAPRPADGDINWSGITPDEQSQDDLLLNDLGRLQALSALLGQMPLAAPVAFVDVSSPFGYRPDPWTGAREFHVGIDLRGPIGTPVFATAPGVVTYAGAETGYGLIVVIDHGYGLSTRYSHLDRIEVTDGEKIGLHQEIALLGNTGWSTGPHLLYETRVDGQPQDPMQFIKEADVQK